MDISKQIKRCEIITQVSERMIDKKAKTGLVTYNYKKEEIKDAKNIDIFDYAENYAKDRFNKSLKFLHMDNETSKSKTYKPVLSNITYIIALPYDIENDSNWICTLNRIIKENYEKIDANELASFFIPFYHTENWDILKNTNETETQNFKDFLHRHKETLNLFIELWKLDIKCYQTDLKELCTSFYSHEDLPSKAKYQKMLDAYEN